MIFMQSFRVKSRFYCSDSESRHSCEIPFASLHGQHRHGLLDRSRLGQFGEDFAQMCLRFDVVGFGGLDQAIEQIGAVQSPRRATPTEKMPTAITMCLVGDAAQALLLRRLGDSIAKDYTPRILCANKFW